MRIVATRVLCFAKGGCYCWRRREKAEGQSDERYFSFVAVQETEIREPGAWQAEYYQLSSNIDLANQSSGLCAPHELNSRRMRFPPRVLACSLLLSSRLHDHSHH